MRAKPKVKVTTCEQYVLIQLQKVEKTIEDLTTKADDLNYKIAKLLHDRNSELARLIRQKGRDEIVNQARSQSPSDESVIQDGRIKTFADWANGYINEYAIPEFMTEDEFMFIFEPELMSIYIDLIDEAKEETNAD